MVLETHMKLCDWIFWKKLFAPQKLENGPKVDQKQGFFNSKKN